MKNSHHSIAAIERDTGLSKDVLRKWEQRYGFPAPLRDAQGERIYPEEQLQRLRLIRRLVDRGRRPGAVVPLSAPELEAMLADVAPAPESTLALETVDAVMACLKGHDGVTLQGQLDRALMKVGLQLFVVDFVAPLNVLIGEAWLRGDIEIAEEHLYTEQVQNVLRSAIARQTSTGGSPRVLLTTFPDELHALGLLMVEALLATEGATCTSLGTQTPVDDIARLAAGGQIDIVALSFSGAYPVRHAVDGIRRLRDALPPSVELWCGGAGLLGRRPSIAAVEHLESVEACLGALQAWHRAHPTT
ncbi:MAG: MerR family transcriptional regulator [Rhodocyclaceae bacterium]|nr:MerR family transcriptional regulator [Rhodocyclaceae bacterium]